MNIELLGFLTLSFLIAITPGPSVVYVVSYSLRYGPRAGIVSTLGINAGSIVFIVLATFGLSAVLNVYPSAVVMIQIVGGAYVIYLATLMWPRAPSRVVDGSDLEEERYTSLFAKGFVTSVLNPKDMLFYTAFIPTFIPSGITGGSYRSYFFTLALAYMFIGLVTKSTFAMFAGSIKRMLDSGSANIVNRCSSIALFSLGAFLVGRSMLSVLA